MTILSVSILQISVAIVKNYLVLVLTPEQTCDKLITVMSTRAIIIGKTKDGFIHWGQTHFDGYRNTEWLNKNMLDESKREEFLNYLTEGEEGHGISSLSYKRVGWNDYDETKPDIDWYDEGYNCEKSKDPNLLLERFNQGFFDFPEYASIYNEEKGIWEDYDLSENENEIEEVIKSL